MKALWRGQPLMACKEKRLTIRRQINFDFASRSSSSLPRELMKNWMQPREDGQFMGLHEYTSACERGSRDRLLLRRRPHSLGKSTFCRFSGSIFRSKLGDIRVQKNRTKSQHTKRQTKALLVVTTDPTDQEIEETATEICNTLAVIRRKFRLSVCVLMWCLSSHCLLLGA